LFLSFFLSFKDLSMFSTPALARFAGAAILAASASTANADITLSIVQTSSSLTLGGNVSGVPITAQSAGSLTARYTGPVVITDPPYSASFGVVSANAAAGITGNYSPLVGGAAGSAPASYGGQANIIIVGNVPVAVRGLRLGMSSGSLALTAGSFPASGVTLSIIAGTADYNAGVFGTGTTTLSGLSSAAGSGAGTLAVSGTTGTFTLPVNATYNTTAAGLPLTITVTGTLVATGTVPPACPADFNMAGGVTVQDIFDFLAAYFGSDPRADFNGAGGITVQDIFDFLAAYFTGCV
jgi:hypothetical protein